VPGHLAGLRRRPEGLSDLRRPGRHPRQPRGRIVYDRRRRLFRSVPDRFADRAQAATQVRHLKDAPMIEMKNVSKWYGEFRVLNQCSTFVGKGDVVVICGPSGSGKSTLIKCVNGLEPFQEGTVTV